MCSAVDAAEFGAPTLPSARGRFYCYTVGMALIALTVAVLLICFGAPRPWASVFAVVALVLELMPRIR